ncbi:MAG: hypothetical protein E5V29_21945 [Mesorhizobium sp.]|nr:MAG: hypothetical protein E5V29_21945 [Mesorhizobium sp.]
MKISAGRFVSPKGIDVDHGKSRVLCWGNFDLPGLAVIVDQVMSGKKFVAALTPFFFFRNAPTRTPRNPDSSGPQALRLIS